MTSLCDALRQLVREVEFEAAVLATKAGLGASEWEAFVPRNLWIALEDAKEALDAA